jgi:hypothetical protein
LLLFPAPRYSFGERSFAKPGGRQIGVLSPDAREPEPSRPPDVDLIWESNISAGRKSRALD